jgi:opacity protein-like surface antigen
VGSFSDKSANPVGSGESSGWANPGPAVQITIGYNIKNSYGLSFLIGGQENKQDENALMNNLKPFYSDTSIFSANTKSWKIGKTLVGGFIQLPLSKRNRFYLGMGVMGGLLKTSIPGYSYVVYTKYNGTIFTSAGGSHSDFSMPWAFCYQLNAGLRWQFSKKISFVSNINYSHSSPKWKYTIYGNDKTTYPVSDIKLLVGIRYYL